MPGVGSCQRDLSRLKALLVDARAPGATEPGGRAPPPRADADTDAARRFAALMAPLTEFVREARARRSFAFVSAPPLPARSPDFGVAPPLILRI